MEADLVSDLIKSLGPTLLDLAVGAIGGFIAGFLSYKFGSRRDVAKIKAEYEFEIKRLKFENLRIVLSQLWSLIQEAHRYYSIVTSPYKEYPDFKYISNKALDEFLKQTRLSEFQKQELRESSDKNKYYMEKIFWYSLHDAELKGSELEKYFRENRILIPDQVKTLLDELVNLIASSLRAYELWHRTSDPELMRSVRDEIKKIGELLNQIEVEIQSNLNSGA